MPLEKDFKLGLSFDDVLIVPAYSRITTRKLIDLRARLSRNIQLNMPIVSANMDTVTEAVMAIAVAREGGIGIIHRFMSVDQQVAEVRRVKRAETLVITDPITISREATLKDVLDVMKKNQINGVLVVDGRGFLEGIVTSRDVRFRVDSHKKVFEIMTPRSKLITASLDVSKEEAVKLFDIYKIEKLPLVDNEGRLRGLITAADFAKTSKHRMAAKDGHGRLIVGAAIGVKDGLERSARLIQEGVDILVIDIAHGHHESVLSLLRYLKQKYPAVDVVAGNVATSQGTEDLIKAGADAVKVGIGPGKACSTRIIAGAGVPQITAILTCSEVARHYNIPVIADGGIKNSGDLAKAIGAGASTAMIGGLLAGTKESPGEYFIEDGAAFKIYRGLASKAASVDRGSIEYNQERQTRIAEGINTTVSYRGEVATIIQSLLDGLQSGMSYSGAANIAEFWQKVNFIRVTEAGIREGKPRP